MYFGIAVVPSGPSVHIIQEDMCGLGFIEPGRVGKGPGVGKEPGRLNYT